MDLTGLLLQALRSTLVVSVLIPFGLAYLQGASKAVSSRGGPTLYNFFLRPRRVPLEDRALGLDLILAALASQVSFLALYAVSPSVLVLDPEVSTTLAILRISVQDRVELSLLVIALLLGLVVILTLAIKLWGHQDQGEGGSLREEFVTFPNVLGYIMLLLVWALNAGAA